jgi:hypothetical protein
MSSGLCCLEGFAVLDTPFIPKFAAFRGLLPAFRRLAVFVRFFFHEAGGFLDVSFNAHLNLQFVWFKNLKRQPQICSTLLPSKWACSERPWFPRVTPRHNNEGETHMRLIVLTTAAISLCASVAFAQDMPAQQGPANPAVKAMHDNNSSTPVVGANSFTKGEAVKQIEAKGYTQVTKLKKDKSGVWRGMATKSGQSGPISVDYQGNVN